MLTILIGLPGSGKSMFLAATYKEHPDVVFDDFHGGAVGDSEAFTASQHYEALRAKLLAGSDCIISDIAYCQETRLAAAIEGVRVLANGANLALEIKFLYFANDADACRHNVVHRFTREPGRDYAAELRNIDDFSKHYNPPSDCMPVLTCCRERERT